MIVLRRMTALPEHEFWPADLPADFALEGATLLGHRQLTDAYLLGLAKAKGGVLATLDRGIRALAAGPEQVEIIAGFLL
jgi:predicted nucleic acid-binding protein